jgi:hypothetical protein
MRLQEASLKEELAQQGEWTTRCDGLSDKS